MLGTLDKIRALQKNSPFGSFASFFFALYAYALSRLFDACNTGNRWNPFAKIPDRDNPFKRGRAATYAGWFKE
jgi:hypothetical protein